MWVTKLPFWQRFGTYSRKGRSWNTETRQDRRVLAATNCRDHPLGQSYQDISIFSGSHNKLALTDVFPQFRHCHLSVCSFLWQVLGGFDPLTPHQSDFVSIPWTLQILFASSATAPQSAQINAFVFFGTGMCFLGAIMKYSFNHFSLKSFKVKKL